MTPAILGFVIAVTSFAVLQFVVLKHFRAFTLPCLLLAVGGGLMAAILFPEPGGTLYQTSWMMGMSLCVAIGFIVGAVRKNRNRS